MFHALLLAAPGLAAPVAPAENPIADAIELKRIEVLSANHTPQLGDVFVVELEEGVFPGIAIQGPSDGWTPLTRVDPWWGSATLVLQGHSAGTAIEALEYSGWGESLTARPAPGWDGRVHFRDLTIYASGGNAVALGRYDSQEVELLQDVRFYDCTFLDHPDPEIRVIRPISANQCSLQFFRCTWDMPNSREHAVYVRNPFDTCGMFDCEIVAVGAQCWQEVSRPSEGPYLGHGTTLLIGNRFRNYHRDPARSGSAISLAGTARDAIIYDNEITDVERPDGEQSYGAIVAWDGGDHYGPNGEFIAADESNAGDYGVGRVWVIGNLFVQKDPNRAILRFNSCEGLMVWGNGIFGSRPVSVMPNVNSQGHLLDAGVGFLTYGYNNCDFAYQWAQLASIDSDLQVDPDLRLYNEKIGHASSIQKTAVMALN